MYVPVFSWKTLNVFVRKDVAILGSRKGWVGTGMGRPLQACYENMGKQLSIFYILGSTYHSKK